MRTDFKKKTNPTGRRRKRKLWIAILAAAAACIAVVFFLSARYPGKMKRLYQKLFIREGTVRLLTEVEPDGTWVDVSCSELPGNQSLLLINENHHLGDGFTPDVAQYKASGVYMNRCIMDSYAALAEAVEQKFGQKLYVRSAYRSAEEQQAQLESGSDKAAALGASEHQAGLALDVYVPYYAGDGFLDCEAGRWVNENCGDYGFIIRYPSYGEESTGIAYEPWHIRYVGQPHAEIIMRSQTTLERYMDFLQEGKAYQYGAYYILPVAGNTVSLPADYESVSVSPDNQGGNIVTVKMPRKDGS